MADEPPRSAPGFQVRISYAHLTATAALLATVLSGGYIGIEWITRMQNSAIHQEQRISELNKQIEVLDQELDQERERDGQVATDLREKIGEAEKQIASMMGAYQSVKRLEDRYEGAFARFQPQPKRRR